MSKNRLKHDAESNGTPSTPKVMDLDPLALAQLERLLAVRETQQAQQREVMAKKEAVAARSEALTHQRALLAQQIRDCATDLETLDSEMAAIMERVRTGDQERTQFLTDLGIDVAVYSPRLEDGKLILTER